MSRSLKVLLVEDNPDDAELILRELVHSGFDATAKRVDTEAGYLVSLQDQHDLVLSDYTMPEFNGILALELLKKSGLEIPFIIVSGSIGEEMAVDAIKRGASDYLLKDRLKRLGPAVRRALLEVEERNQRRQIEKQFIEAQKMEVIGQLAGGVAHDFNNILGVIMGYSDLTMMKFGENEEIKSNLEMIRSSAERASGLTRQLLVFSRKQTVELVVLDLNAVLKDADKMLRRLIDENIELTVAPGTPIGRIKADSGYIGQVLMNLAVNARDAMPTGGKLTIATNNVTLEANDARAHADAAGGEYVMLSVSDSGTGMTEEVKAHIFEAFFTTKPKGKGTGLGLATCATIVEQSGGHICVDSEVGQGTTFKIYFPRVEQAIDEPASGPRTGPLPRGNETLLLVEDEPFLRLLASNVLEAQGYHVLRASNGQDGLRVARECKKPPIGLVITDVIMPQMGGKVMGDLLQTANSNLKILFTSGYPDDAITRQGVLQTGGAFLPKPYATAALVLKVREMLDGK